MPALCCIKNCRAKRNTPGTSFHCFPLNEELRNKWVERIGADNMYPMKKPKICSRHFDPYCIIQSYWGVSLRPDSVPTIFEPFLSRERDEGASASAASATNDNRAPGNSVFPRPRKHFSGDFRIEDMSCPEKAKAFFKAVSNDKIKSKKKEHTMKLRNSRLNRRLEDLRTMLEMCEEKQMPSSHVVDMMKALLR